ncbi:MAG: (2Fe-2S) ferredoxin domain-containing protein [Spirochaetia bacterium]|nr:(2Fe-2S) ferredoxin domain-containing protein [Spirochaetia bacterium]
MALTICVGSSCHLKGSRRIVEHLQALIETSGFQDKIELKGAFCMGKCVSGVSVLLDGAYHSLQPEETNAFFTQNILKKPGGP